MISVKTNIDRSNTFDDVPLGQYFEVNSGIINSDLFFKTDPRTSVSDKLINNNEISLISDRTCGVEGSLENRKRLRWVFKTSEIKVYKYLYENVSKTAPYYFMIIFYSVVLFTSFLVISRIVPIYMPQYFIFLGCILVFLAVSSTIL